MTGSRASGRGRKINEIFVENFFIEPTLWIEIQFKNLIFTLLLSAFCSSLHNEPFWVRFRRMIEREYHLALSNGRSFHLVGTIEKIRNNGVLQTYLKSRGLSRTDRNRIQVDFEDFQLEQFERLFLSIRTIGQSTGLIEHNNEPKSLSNIPRIGQLLQDELEVNKYLLTQIFQSTTIEENDLFLKWNYKFGSNSTASGDSFSKKEFLEFLFSEENSLLDPAFVNTEASEEYLSAPLCHYWINSSHNTYLSGNQYNSTSSVECYARAIRQGCRCIGKAQIIQ